MLTLSLFAVLGWTLVERFDQFGQDWPKYRAPLREAAAAIESRMATFEQHVSEIEPAEKERVVTVTESHPFRSVLVGRMLSVMISAGQPQLDTSTAEPAAVDEAARHLSSICPYGW